MPNSRVALIIIGAYKDAWWKLSPAQQKDFIARVGMTVGTAGIAPITGYRLISTPGAFIEVWEGADRAAVDRAVKDLQAMGYTRYVDSRWLIGERETENDIQPERTQSSQRKR